MNIFVTKLSRSTTSDDLIQLFEAFGEVRSAKVIIDRMTGTSKGYGFIEMGTEESAAQAISSLNETTFQDAIIIVKPANPREERPPVRRAIIKKSPQTMSDETDAPHEETVEDILPVEAPEETPEEAIEEATEEDPDIKPEVE